MSAATRSRNPKTHRVIFTAESVRAIQGGHKDVTRRLLAVQPEAVEGGRWSWCVSSTERSDRGLAFYRAPDPQGRVFTDRGRERDIAQVRCPYGEPGDRLAVREAWRPERIHGAAAIRYAADDSFVFVGSEALDVWEKLLRDAKGNLLSPTAWRSPLYLPAWASRIALEVVNVRVERLHAIDEADALREGVQPWTKDGTLHKFAWADHEGDGPCWPWVDCPRTAREAYAKGWDQINAKHGAPWTSNPWVFRVEFARVGAPVMTKDPTARIRDAYGEDAELMIQRHGVEYLVEALDCHPSARVKP